MEGETGANHEPTKFDTAEKYIDIIKSAPEGDLIAPKSYELPTNINGLSAQRLKAYVEYPIIWNKFPDHFKRREWEKEKIEELRAKSGNYAAEELSKVFQENKLGRNPSNLAFHMRNINAPKHLVDEVQKLYEDNIADPLKWDSTEKQTKIEVVEKLSSLAARALLSQKV